ncbi:MAG: DUF1800 family protein [Flavobacteriales bacterium]|nr:DUF1800 family protein [Flavobacteriales bacterium]
MPVTPYSGTFGREELKHLLRRTMFGATNVDIAYFSGQSLGQVVDALLTINTAQTPPLKNYWVLNGGVRDPNAVDAAVPFGSTWVGTPHTVTAVNANVYRMYSFMAWRTGLMIHQERSILEKMLLFWYNHMPIQVSVVFNGLLHYGYDQLLRNKCLGNFRQLMYDVTLDPCMLEYLNGKQNMASAPDENYARELMELFTLGEGSGYTETDVQAASKVLTGWSTRETLDGSPMMPQTYFAPGNHTTSNKQFSSFFNNTIIQGQSGTNAGTTELNALLDMIFAKQEVSLFICRQLYRFFVHGEINAQTESELIVPLAELFRNNAGSPDQLKVVMRALLTSDHFFNANNRACMVMSTADIVIGMIRKMHFTFPSESTQLEARYRMFLDAYYICVNCGQNLFDPPNVAGWPAYYQGPQFDELWVDTAAYAARNFAVQGIIGQGFTTGADFYQAASRNVSIDPDYMAIAAEFDAPNDPDNVVSGCADMLYAIPVSQGVKNTLKTQRLLLGQSSDVYWTEAYELRVADPNTTNQTAQMVPSLINFLLLDMAKAGESQMF